MEEIDLKELIGMFLEKKFLIIFVVILFQNYEGKILQNRTFFGNIKL